MSIANLRNFLFLLTQKNLILTFELLLTVRGAGYYVERAPYLSKMITFG